MQPALTGTSSMTQECVRWPLTLYRMPRGTCCSIVESYLLIHLLHRGLKTPLWWGVHSWGWAMCSIRVVITCVFLWCQTYCAYFGSPRLRGMRSIAMQCFVVWDLLARIVNSQLCFSLKTGILHSFSDLWCQFLDSGWGCDKLYTLVLYTTQLLGNRVRMHIQFLYFVVLVQ